MVILSKQAFDVSNQSYITTIMQKPKKGGEKT